MADVESTTRGGRVFDRYRGAKRTGKRLPPVSINDTTTTTTDLIPRAKRRPGRLLLRHASGISPCAFHLLLLLLLKHSVSISENFGLLLLLLLLREINTTVLAMAAAATTWVASSREVLLLKLMLMLLDAKLL